MYGCQFFTCFVLETKRMVSTEGFEPPTSCSVGRYSIQLSHADNVLILEKKVIYDVNHKKGNKKHLFKKGAPKYNKKRLKNEKKSGLSEI